MWTKSARHCRHDMKSVQQTLSDNKEKENIKRKDKINR